MYVSTIEIDMLRQAPSQHFTSQVNVAVPFIDRHVDESSGLMRAIRNMRADVTYADLACNIDRCANVLVQLRRGERTIVTRRSVKMT